MTSRHALPIALGLLALTAPALAAEANLEIVHYGRLLGADDAGVTGEHQLTFTLWEAPVKLPSETPAWSETYAVTVTNGFYSAVLGAQITGKQPLPAAKFDKTLYLAVAVDGGAELAPRLTMGRVPLAYRAETAAIANDVSCSNCIDESELAFDPKPADGSVTTPKLADAAVTTEKLAAGSVAGSALADGAVTAAKIKAGEVGTAQLAEGSVTALILAVESVTSAKLAAKAVKAGNVDDGAIGTAQLANASVTADKLAPNAITPAAIAEGAIPWDRLEAGQVPAARLPPIAVAGKTCAVGQIVTAFDAAGAPICSEVLGAATGLDAIFPTKWAATLPGDRGSGELPPSTWIATGNKTLFVKVSASSKLRVTVSDNLRAPTPANSYAYYEVRVNGSYLRPRCYSTHYDGNSAGWTQNMHWPHSQTCIADGLAPGLYEFQSFIYGAPGSGTGNPYVHWNTGQPLILVEEIPAEAKFAYSTTGAEQSSTSSSMTAANGRTVNYTKQSATSHLRLTLSDTFRAAEGVSLGEGTVEIRMDNSPLPSRPCSYRKYDHIGTAQNFHNPFDLICIYPNIPAGAHSFNVWFQTNTGSSQVYLGWSRGNPLLLVEEIDANPKWSYMTGAGEQGEFGAQKSWFQVANRTLAHTATGPGRNLKVTYSDTWRAASGCNGDWGSLAIYMDGNPMNPACYTSNHVHESGNATNNHHHAVNLTCVARNVSAGSHTFTVWGYNNCGNSFFGWSRGQYSMQVEELP